MNISTAILEKFKTFYDETTLRPRWAGQVEVRSKKIQSSHSQTGSRNAANTILRPCKITGIICPMKTIGRKTKNVIGFNGKYYPLDRGHLMAYSLGAPATSSIMRMQPRIMNQSITNLDNQPGDIKNLSWRATEVYLAFLSHFLIKHNLSQRQINTLLQANTAISMIGSRFPPKYSIQINSSDIRLGSPLYNYLKQENILDLPYCGEYKTMKRPCAILRYEAVAYYGSRGDQPKNVQVDVYLLYGKHEHTTKILSRNFHWEESLHHEYLNLQKAMYVKKKHYDGKNNNHINKKRK